jgi:transposase-like protein
MSKTTRRRYSPKLKFQVVLEALSGEKTPAQIAKAYGVHPNSVGLWKKAFLERGPEVFARDTTVQDYERRIAELERLIGRKEVEIELLKGFLRRAP